LNEEKKQQVIALGRLGWSLRRIQRTIGVRRETAATYLRAAGIRQPSPKPANEVITDFGAELALRATVAPAPQPGHSPSVSACAPYQEVIELGLSRGRNAMAIWQELVDTCGFAAGYQSVRRFVRKLHPSPSPEACAVIETAPGEEARRLRRRPDGPRPPDRQVPAHAAVRDDAGLQPQVGSSAGVPFQFADLGGVT